MEVMFLYTTEYGAASRIRFRLKATSSAVRAEPSWKLIPCRIFMSMAVFSGLVYCQASTIEGRYLS